MLGAELRRERAWVAALLAAAVAYRLWATGWARLTTEEAEFWVTALQIARGEAFPSYGPPLTGQEARHPGPVFFYLMALPQLFGASPRLGSAFVALLHGGALGLLWDGLRRVVSPRGALFALALGAFAPWDVLYADRVWLSCVAPVFATAALYATLRAKEGPLFQGLMIFLLLLLPQLHMSAPIVWVAAGVWLWRGAAVRWSRPALALGALLAVLSYLPPLWAELGSGFANTAAILGHGSQGSWSRFFNLPGRVFGYGFAAATAEIGYHFERGYWTGFGERNLYLTPAGWGRWFGHYGVLGGLGVLVSVGLGFWGWGASLRGLFRHLRDLGGLRGAAGLSPGDRLTLAILAGLVAAWALLAVSRKAFYPHYVNLLMPFLLWPPAWALARASVRPRWGAAASAVTLAVSMTAMFAAGVRYYRSVDGANGLEATLALTEVVSREPGPVRLVFRGFDNQRAFELVAEHLYGRRLEVVESAAVAFTVHNDAVSAGPADERAVEVRGVRMVRVARGGAP